MLQLIAQATNEAVITNPVIGEIGKGADFGGSDPGAGGILATLIVTIWQSIMTVGGLFTLLWILYGGITWLTAGGDEGKLENARNRISNAIIGLAVLFAAAAFANFIGPAIGFDLLKLDFPSVVGPEIPPLPSTVTL